MKLTQRKLNSIYFSIWIILNLTVIFLLKVATPIFNNLLTDLNLDYQFDPTLAIQMSVVLLLLSLLIFSTIWSIRNRIWKGKESIKSYFLILKIRKELILASYSDDQNVTEKVVRLPKIKIKFDDKQLNTGRLIIRDSVEFHEKLEKATFTPALKGFKVETVYQSDDGDWFIFDFYATDSQNQDVFTELSSFLDWSNQTTNQYQIRFDGRLSADLKHILLVGATRTGKTYGLIGLLLQMINKSTTYHLYFADPKNDQLRKIGNWVDPKKTAVTTEELIKLIEQVYQRLIEREKEMEKATATRMTGDYRDVKLEPIFLVFDEFSSFINVLESKEKKQVLGHLTAVVQRGAGAGVFLLLIMQKSDATTLPTAIRSNLLLKIVLGNATTTTYSTAFESSSDVPIFRFGKGQGVYLDDTMSKPKLFSFPYLKFIDAFDGGSNDPALLWQKNSSDQQALNSEL
ncbi:type IV secretory system conjugative DNA transfer family protein [Marinilactibacillus psychrotolerans]